MTKVVQDIRGCTLCADQFLGTKTKYSPRPVVCLDKSARILIAGQAPGVQVHNSGTPFLDKSGDRLRDWMGLEHQAFYAPQNCAFLPMAFCFPGYNASGHDLPPPKICAQTWRKPALDMLENVQLTLLIGAYAQGWHLPDKMSVSARLVQWQTYAPDVFVLPHPSWRNSGWLNKNPWFERQLLPVLRDRVKQVLA